MEAANPEKKYVWMVRSLEPNNEIVQSEVWEFKLGEEQVETLQFFRNYIDLNTGEPLSLLNLEEYLKLRFDNLKGKNLNFMSIQKRSIMIEKI